MLDEESARKESKQEVYPYRSRVQGLSVEILGLQGCKGFSMAGLDRYTP